MHDLDQHFELFKTAIVKLDAYQFHTKSIKKQCDKYEQLLIENDFIKKKMNGKLRSSRNFRYKDYANGESRLLTYTDFTNRDASRIELEIKNRHYQHILMNAFEQFARYLEHAAFYLKWEKEFSPMRFIKDIHNTIPNIPATIKIRSEIDPWFLNEADLLLNFSIIQQLRHQIAHTSGFANNKSVFIEKCLKRTNLHNSKQQRVKGTTYINSYFENEEFENLIFLVEVQDAKNENVQSDRLSELISELASYVIFIHPHIKRSLIK